MSKLNVREVITEIRERIHDRDSRAFDDAEVLRVMDNQMRWLSTQLRICSEYIGIDYVDVQTSSLTAVETGVLEYDPPEWLNDIQLIEVISAGSSVPVQVPRGTLEEKDVWRGRIASATLSWIWGPRGKIQLRGGIINFSSVRIWFVREVPPMFYSAVASGTTGSATLGAATGGYKNRSGIYDGIEFECTADSGVPANVGQVRRCSTFASGVLNFATVWPGAISSTTQLAMVVPLPAEYLEFFMALCQLQLFQRAGSPEEIGSSTALVALLQEKFDQGIARRSSGEPARVFSSRRHGR